MFFFIRRQAQLKFGYSECKLRLYVGEGRLQLDVPGSVFVDTGGSYPTPRPRF